MLNDLRNELSRLYQDEASARRVVSDAGLPSIFIDFDGPMVDVWHQVIQQASIRHKLPDLVQVAMRDYPQSAILQRVYGLLLYGPTNKESVSKAEDEAVPDYETKIDRMYEMVNKTNERLVRVETVQIGLIIALIVIGVWVKFG